jgi:hypothetical protein
VQTAIAVKLSDLREIDISLPAKSGNLEELLFPNSQINNLNNVHANLTPVKANWKIFLCVFIQVPILYRAEESVWGSPHP